MTQRDSVEMLVSRAEIHDVLMRYARGIDRCDFELVASCYHPGAHDDHGRFKGTVEEFIPWVRTELERFDSTMHFLGNVLIEFDDLERARAATYCVAYHRLAGQDVDAVAGLRYVDVFERRQGDWRIAERRIVVEWNRHDDVTVPRLGPEYLRGRRDGTDPVQHPGSR